VPAPRKLADDDLLRTAARLFARHGYEGTSISMLVDELGVTRPTLYSRVASKRALFDAVYERAMAWYSGHLREMVLLEAPPLERLRGLVRLQLAALDALHESIEVLRLTAVLEPRPAWARWWRELDDELVATIAEAQAVGQIDATVDPLVAKHVFWATINDLPNWYRPGRLGPDDVADQVVSLLSTGR
jgi:TetR/AcrR family transcriptional regulator, cholesterol catabolism regulator